MADKIKVNTTRLGTDAESVKSNIQKIKKSMEDMKKDVTQLDSMWDGPTSEAFKKAFQDDMNALNTIIKNLEQIYNFETTAKSKYESCERQVASKVSGIRV